MRILSCMSKRERSGTALTKTASGKNITASSPTAADLRRAHGGGRRPRGVRRLLHRFSREAKLPVICLLDCDPWGHYIYSVIKQGSISLAFESSRLAIPEARFLGIRAKDFEECELPDTVKIELNENDKKRAN